MTYSVSDNVTENDFLASLERCEQGLHNSATMDLPGPDLMGRTSLPRRLPPCHCFTTGPRL